MYIFKFLKTIGCLGFSQVVAFLHLECAAQKCFNLSHQQLASHVDSYGP